MYRKQIQEDDYSNSSSEDDGTFLGWNHTQRQSVLLKRRGERIPNTTGGSRAGTNSSNYSESLEEEQHHQQHQHHASNISSPPSSVLGKTDEEIIESLFEEKKQWKALMRQSESSEQYDSVNNDDADDDEDDDASYSSHDSTTSCDIEEEEDCIDEDDDNTIPKSSLIVRILNINCPLPPKLREITSSFNPTFQFGLVKESKKSEFLFGAKPKMLRTMLTSSQILNRNIEEVRWDNLCFGGKNGGGGSCCVDDMFLGVELRIWGWYPEVLQSCKDVIDMQEQFIEESKMKDGNNNSENNDNDGNNNNQQHDVFLEQQEHQESKIETKIKGFVRSRMSFLGGSHDRSTTAATTTATVISQSTQQSTTTTQQAQHENIQRIREDGTSSHHHHDDINHQQQHHISSSTHHRSSNNKKVPPIRLGTLLIPIQNIVEGFAIEKSYALNFKVSGGTRDARKLIEKLISSSIEQPVVTLKLEIQISPSCEILNKNEDNLLLSSLKSCRSHLLRDSNNSSSILGSGGGGANNDDQENDMEADENFIDQNYGSKASSSSAMFNDNDSVTSSIVLDRGSKTNSFLTTTGAPIAPTTVARRDSMEETPDATEVEPILKPGIVDFICIVGARDIGDQRINDDGSKGWLPTNPECTLMEQFPSPTYHTKNGRNRILPDKIEYFCFPEGCKIWRGTEPPKSADMNLPPRNGEPIGSYSPNGTPNNAANSSTFLSSSAGSTQAFDECLNCTTTLTWFVLQSNSDEYGSRCLKNYGVCIRFFVPAPSGIDCTQDDYAQQISINHPPDQYIDSSSGSSKKKRNILWIPLGICVMTALPIVGTMEAVLLRICQTLCNRRPRNMTMQEYFKTKIYKDLANLIINYPSPIYGVLHCSIPFLQGQRLHVTLPPYTGLPALPHGGSVTAVCRLLGAEGFTILLAAFLTECKILLHSHDVSNLAMVAEVFCAFIYPFSYVLPYIPVLPEQVLEYIESPVPYCLGVSSKSFTWIDRKGLSDVVVIDLDNGFHTPDYFDGRARAFKLPSPLPAAVCQSIHKGIFHLLRQEEDIEEQYGHHMHYNTSFSACYSSVPRHLPRLESESLAEREFRILVAIQVCSLIRGYQDCLFLIGASQPVFNRDKFLRYAPALFEERACSTSSAVATPNGTSTVGQNQTQATSQKILSPRSKRFLSLLANTQQFHQILERLDMEDLNFFHEIMDTFDWDDSPSNGNDEKGDRKRNNTSKSTVERRKDHLSTLLEKAENPIPTYRVDRRYFDKCLAKRASLTKVIESEQSKVEDDQSSEDGSEGYESNIDDEFLYESSETSDEDYDEFEFFEEDYNQTYDNYEEYCQANRNTYFTKEILKPMIAATNPTKDASSPNGTGGEEEELDVHSLNVQYLELLDKNPWNYDKIFPSEKEYEGKENNTDDANPKVWDICPKIKLRQAIGEKRYEAYCIEQQKLSGVAMGEDEEDESTVRSIMDNSLYGSLTRNSTTKYELAETKGETTDEPVYSQQQAPDVPPVEDDIFLDLNTLLSSAYEEIDMTPSDEAHEPIRKCLSTVDSKNEEWIINAEKALRSSSTFLQSQIFLWRVLSQRNHVASSSNSMRQSTIHRITSYQRPNHQGVVGGVGTRPSTAQLYHGNSVKSINPAGSAAAATASNLSRLTQPAFETLIRLCSAMLDVCLERNLYENAYRLLSNTAGFCCIRTIPVIDIIYMTATISMHPIFKDLRLWKKVLVLHIKDQSNQNTSSNSVTASVTTASTTTMSNTDIPDNRDTNESKKERSRSTAQQISSGEYSAADTKSESEHDAAVTTLYEMLGYGVPAEDLANYATKVSEERNWFVSERGKNLVVLAKLLGLRRDETSTAIIANTENNDTASEANGSKSDGNHDMNNKEYMELIGTYHPTAGITIKDDLVKYGILSSSPEKKFKVRWKELSWFHPTSVASQIKNVHAGGSTVPGHSAMNLTGYSGLLTGILGQPLQHQHKASDVTHNNASLRASIPQHPDVTLPRGYTGRTPITSIGTFSSHSCIATGGLDGSVFLAHTLSFGSPESRKPPSVRGVRLDWDSSSSSIDVNKPQQRYLSNAVSCLASLVPAQHYKPRSNHPDEVLKSLDGCFIIAGTHAGNLNIWNVHDIYNSTVVAARKKNSNRGSHDRNFTSSAASILSNATASTANSLSMELQQNKSNHSISEKKLDMTLRGKALSGHKRGVLCIDVPSPIYRPDTVATGGADGQIKLWNIRNANVASSSHHRTIVTKPGGPILSSSSTPAVAALFAGKGQTTASIGKPSGINNQEAETTSSNADSSVSVLSGHKGKVLCLRSYWNGDQLLSGGSDKTVRLWDLTTSSSTTANRCVQTFICHSGDVTQAHYRGSDIIISASTDRTIAICDVRVGILPVHVLRYHKSHISDLLLGSRSDNTMISASGDGTIATWDLRSFQTSHLKKQQDLNDIKILRSPVAIMKHSTISATNKSITGSINLSCGILSDKTIFSASIDGIVKEWNVSSGACLGEIHTGHSGAISCLSSYSQQKASNYADQPRLDSSHFDSLGNSIDQSSLTNNIYGGLLTCGWDGSIRFRKCNVSNSSSRLL